MFLKFDSIIWFVQDHSKIKFYPLPAGFDFDSVSAVSYMFINTDVVPCGESEWVTQSTKSIRKALKSHLDPETSSYPGIRGYFMCKVLHSSDILFYFQWFTFLP